LTVFRFALWNLGDSLTTLDELREKLPSLGEKSHWIANDASERFGIVAFGELPAPAVEEARRLIGTDPVAGEEFDVLD
jgi:hypothetical protein